MSKRSRKSNKARKSAVEASKLSKATQLLLDTDRALRASLRAPTSVFRSDIAYSMKKNGVVERKCKVRAPSKLKGLTHKRPSSVTHIVVDGLTRCDKCNHVVEILHRC